MQKVLVDPSGRFRTLKILLVGMGDSGDLTYERLYKAGFTISRTMREINCKDFAFDIPGIGRCGLDVPEMTGSMVSGLFDILRDESGSEKPENPKTVRILADDKHVNEVMQGVQKAIAKESSGRVTVEIERSVETK
jgi:hypothetical protein